MSEQKEKKKEKVVTQPPPRRDGEGRGAGRTHQSAAEPGAWNFMGEEQDQSCSFNQTNFQPAPSARTRSPLSAGSGHGCEARLGGLGLGGVGGYELWGTAVTGGEFTCLICCQRLPNAASINIPSGWITTGRLKRHWSSAMTSRSGLALNPANALRIFLPNIHQRERSLTTFPTLPDSQCAERPSETRGPARRSSHLFSACTPTLCVCVCVCVCVVGGRREEPETLGAGYRDFNPITICGPQYQTFDSFALVKCADLQTQQQTADDLWTPRVRRRWEGKHHSTT